jgi:diguanylate cyclase (GGDEF)-like protein
MLEKILCVDDEQSILDGFKRVLRKQFDLTTHTSGAAGLLAIQEKGPFSVVISDMDMPGMNGVDFLAKTREVAPDTVRIMLTGKADLQVALDAVNEGNIFRFLTKPISPDVLAKSLEAGCRQYQLVKNQSLYLSHLKELATVDELTGVANRRAFNERFEEEWMRAMRSQEKLTVALVDIDFFKKYNDQYGHIPGDKCLRAVAQAISGTLMRSTDFFARYGGEEFALVLPFTAGPRDLLEKCRLAVEQLAVKHEAINRGYVSVSIGGASLTTANGFYSATDFLEAVDHELYQAKEAGRNRVSFADLDL